MPFLSRSAFRFLPLFALFLLCVGARAQTSPPPPAQQLTAAHLVPLASLSGRVDVFSALHVAQQFLLFLPLGSVLAVWPLRRSRHLWPAVWLAVGIEAGHIVIADRFFDVTNALVSCGGLGIGWLVVQRSGFAPHREASAGGRH